ncbi:hypothetical protein LTS18_011955 [Coniosporium uncinatum]|uniref:Uncharacterized protein n=1 Tax=Coniosporium uncinatum TaxID=93489 RepID=A0ACC3D9R8_9PEZI|nr:hypothetical protein LTS18_011955 [Coniosporium uncinatum]
MGPQLCVQVVTRVIVCFFLVTTSVSQAIPPRLVHQYQPVTWVENLAVRPNGNLLPITTTSPLLNQLDPSNGQLQLVHDFSAVGNAIQGITALCPDVFVVNALTCNITALTCTRGSVSSWLADFRSPNKGNKGRKCYKTHGPSSPCVDVKQIAAFPDAGFLNGIAALDSNTVLMADSLLGGIWRLDVDSGARTLLFTDPAMAPTATVSTGINGIRIRPSILYFTNSALGTFNSIPIDPQSGNKTGPAIVIATGFAGPDDFEVDLGCGAAYLANGALNQLLRVSIANGTSSVIADVPGPTSARWARSWGKEQLYVSTIGGLLQYVTGNVTVGGAVYGFELERH